MRVARGQPISEELFAFAWDRLEQILSREGAFCRKREFERLWNLEGITDQEKTWKGEWRITGFPLF